MIAIFGISFAFGVYQVYYQDVMLPQHSPSAISWIGTIQASFTFLFGLVSGPLFDKGYFFHVVVGASTGLVLSFMLLSICKEYWQILLCQGLLAGICSGLLYISTLSQVPRYFSSQRGRALGLVTSGVGVGGIIYPLIFRRLLRELGFGWATRVVGFVTMGFLLVAAVLIKPLHLNNAPKKLRDPTMFKDPYYVSFIFSGLLIGFGMMIPYYDSGLFWVARFDHNLDSAFYTLIIANVGGFFGRLLISAAVDYGVPAEYMMTVSTAVTAALGFGWIGVHTKSSYYAFLVLWGIFSSANATLPTCLMMYLIPRPEVFATRMGLVLGMTGVGMLVGPPIANALIKHQTNFLGVQLWVGITCTVALVSIAFTSFGVRRARKARAAAAAAAAAKNGGR
ncbi:hypothetical protein ANO11243_050230 [Dothideomycetidae sp. 11243]|nr:hypothetical protein ANO11243_050230 [fungal sp. No.11243]